MRPTGQPLTDNNLSSWSGPGDENDGAASKVESFRVLKSILCNFEGAISAHKLPANGEGLTFPGKYLFELLSRVEITPDRFDMVIQQLGAVVEELEERDVDDAKGIRKHKNYNLDFLRDCFKVRICNGPWLVGELY